MKKREEIYIRVGLHHCQDKWTALNTDNSRDRNTSKAGCGELLRDANGRWVVGFSHFAGNRSAYKVKFWDIEEGIEVAWTMGIKNISSAV
ncbi:hypothetical protein AHAS_Ahas15G0091800 [Arachis hypogaea]